VTKEKVSILDYYLNICVALVQNKLFTKLSVVIIISKCKLFGIMIKKNVIFMVSLYKNITMIYTVHGIILFGVIITHISA